MCPVPVLTRLRIAPQRSPSLTLCLRCVLPPGPGSLHLPPEPGDSHRAAAPCRLIAPAASTGRCDGYQVDPVVSALPSISPCLAHLPATGAHSGCGAQGVAQPAEKASTGVEASTGGKQVLEWKQRLDSGLEGMVHPYFCLLDADALRRG